MVKKAKSQRYKRKTGKAPKQIKAEISYTAPTPGLKNVLFTRGTTRDAAKFIDTVETLARYVGVTRCDQLDHRLRGDGRLGPCLHSHVPC